MWVITYWIVTWIFTVLFGEVITGIISKNPMFFQNVIPITIYYGVITLIFSFLFSRFNKWMILVLVFLYGGFIEVFFFHGIGIFWVAGLFYVFLFGVPYWICNRFRKY